MADAMANYLWLVTAPMTSEVIAWITTGVHSCKEIARNKSREIHS